MHRLFHYVRRMDDRRHAIVIDEVRASLRWSRGYVANVAAAVGLAVNDVRSAARVFNVAAEETPSEVEWVRAIGHACGWAGEIVVACHESLPTALRSPLKTRQDMIVSSDRIRRELGYTDPVSADEALVRTVEWTRSHPPATEALDYSLENSVLEAVAR